MWQKVQREIKTQNRISFGSSTQYNTACEQVLGTLWRRGGKRRESLQLRLQNLNICIEKDDTKCRLADMTLVMTSLPLALVCSHSHSFPLRANWRKSDSLVDGEPQGNWGWNSSSREVVASCPSFSRHARERPGKLARRLMFFHVIVTRLQKVSSPSYPLKRRKFHFLV